MLDALHAAIVARLKVDIPTLLTVEAYPAIQRSVTIPAVLIDLDELAPDDFHDVTVGFQARFKAYCIVDPVPDAAEMDVRNLAAEVATRIIQERDFGVTEVEEGAEVLRIGPDVWKPELEGYLVWAVDFTVGISVGEGFWKYDPDPADAVQQITVGTFVTVGGESYTEPGQHVDVGGNDIPVSEIEEAVPQ